MSEERVFSVGVMAHNEEGNVGNHLRAMLAQRTPGWRMARLILVASGSTDGTVEEALAAGDGDPRIEVMLESQRRGKASAINLFLDRAEGEVAVLANADSIPLPGCLGAMLRRMERAGVRLVGATAVPEKRDGDLTARTAGLLWDVLHRVSLSRPKVSELYALRLPAPRLPERCPVDEATFEALTMAEGGSIEYAWDGKVKVLLPDSLSDLFKQRRRIFCGHLWLETFAGYRPVTMSRRIAAMAALSHLLQTPTELPWMLLLGGLEGLARAAAWTDHLRRRDYSVWPPIRARPAPPCTGAHEGPGVLTDKPVPPRRWRETDCTR